MDPDLIVTGGTVVTGIDSYRADVGVASTRSYHTDERNRESGMQAAVVDTASRNGAAKGVIAGAVTSLQTQLSSVPRLVLSFQKGVEKPAHLLLLVFAASVSGPAPAANVAVILSDRVDDYQEALRGFKETVQHPIVAAYNMDGDLERGRKILTEIETKVKRTSSSLPSACGPYRQS
jgi:hypothetical protein